MTKTEADAERHKRNITRAYDGFSLTWTASASPGPGEPGYCGAALSQFIVEPMTGIEPAYSAWEADVLPLNYIGIPGSAGDHEG